MLKMRCEVDKGYSRLVSLCELDEFRASVLHSLINAQFDFIGMANRMSFAELLKLAHQDILYRKGKRAEDSLTI